MDDPTAFVSARLAEGGLPPRVIEALRAILAEHKPVIPDAGPDAGERCCGRCGSALDDPWLAVGWPCGTIGYLAAIWSSHPDCRPEWKP